MLLERDVCDAAFGGVEGLKWRGISCGGAYSLCPQPRLLAFNTTSAGRETLASVWGFTWTDAVLFVDVASQAESQQTDRRRNLLFFVNSFVFYTTDASGHFTLEGECNSARVGACNVYFHYSSLHVVYIQHSAPEQRQSDGTKDSFPPISDAPRWK